MDEREAEAELALADAELEREERDAVALADALLADALAEAEDADADAVAEALAVALPPWIVKALEKLMLFGLESSTMAKLYAARLTSEGIVKVAVSALAGTLAVNHVSLCSESMGDSLTLKDNTRVW